MVNAFTKYGFIKKGSAQIFQNDNIAVRVYSRGNSRVEMIATDSEGNNVRTKYTDVQDRDKLALDVIALVKDKLGIDITAPTKKSKPKKETKQTEIAEVVEPAMPEIVEPEQPKPDIVEPTIEPEPEQAEPDIALRPEEPNHQPDILKLEAPSDDYSPLLMAMDEVAYAPIEIPAEPDPPAPVAYAASDAGENVQANLIAKVQEREFQTLNAQPNFPFGDKNQKLMTNNTDDADEDVAVSLLDDVRTKEGKYVVEKSGEKAEQLYETPKRKLRFPKIPPLVLVAAVGIIAFIVLRKKVA